MRNWALAAVVVMAVFALIATLYDAGKLRFAYPDFSRYPVRGIDVSRHQGSIDWTRLPDQKIAFAYIKASEGGDLRDARFRINAAGARAAGLRVGAYHFFTLCRPGADQARNFLAATEAAALDLPMAIDLEYTGNCKARPSQEAFDRELGAFIRAIEAEGRRPLLYVTWFFHRDYVKDGPFSDYPLWLMNIVGPLTPPHGSRIAIWQFAHNSRLEGIEGPVDQNVWVGEAQ